MKYVCFQKRPKRWRGFPPAGINMIFLKLTSGHNKLWIASTAWPCLSTRTWSRSWSQLTRDLVPMPRVFFQLAMLLIPGACTGRLQRINQSINQSPLGGARRFHRRAGIKLIINTSRPDYSIGSGAHGAFPSRVLWPYKLGFNSSGDMVRLGVRFPWRHGAAWGSIPL